MQTSRLEGRAALSQVLDGRLTRLLLHGGHLAGNAPALSCLALVEVLGALTQRDLHFGPQAVVLPVQVSGELARHVQQLVDVSGPVCWLLERRGGSSHCLPASQTSRILDFLVWKGIVARQIVRSSRKQPISRISLGSICERSAS